MGGGNEPPPVPKPPRPEQDGTLELDGRRVLPIRRSDTRDFSQYLAAKDKAAELGVSLEIVAEDAFVRPATSSGAVGKGVHIASQGRKCYRRSEKDSWFWSMDAPETLGF